MKLLAVMFIALFAATTARAGDHAKVLYDRKVSDVRVGVWQGQLACNPGFAGSYSAASGLIVDSYWVRVADAEFAALDINGKLTYDDTRLGDFCADLMAKFAGQEFALGNARRTVTEYFGIRYSTCWHWLDEKITLDLNGLRFLGGDQRITVGPAPADACK